MKPRLVRDLKLTTPHMVGTDVEAMRRSCKKFVREPLNTMPAKQSERRTFGPGMHRLVNRALDEAVQKKDGVADNELLAAMRKQPGAVDRYADYLLLNYEARTPKLVSPIPKGVKVYVGGLHPTGGLPGNWALDWICAPGTPILAVERAKITRLSGRDPSDDTWDTQGVYGWTVYYRNAVGAALYFWTHFGRRANLTLGQWVDAGDTIGWVGDQEFRPDHIHGGVTSVYGEADAKKRIRAVADGPRVAA